MTPDDERAYRFLYGKKADFGEAQRANDAKRAAYLRDLIAAMPPPPPMVNGIPVSPMYKGLPFVYDGDPLVPWALTDDDARMLRQFRISPE